MPRREESSAVTGRTKRWQVAKAICVYMEKLGFISTKQKSNSPSHASKKSTSQLATLDQLSVPGIWVFANVETALALELQKWIPSEQTYVVWIKWLNL